MEMRAPRGQTITTVSSSLFYKCVFDEMCVCEIDIANTSVCVKSS